MKKILHFITGLEKGGGAEAMILKVLPSLNKDENAVCCVRGRGEIGKELEKKGVKVYYLDMKNYSDFNAIKRYKKVIEDFQPSIQINYLIHADVFGRIFAKKFGVKKIVSYIRNRHTNFLYSFLDRLTLGRVDYLLTNSEANLGFYRDKYNFPRDKSSCIPNGVDLNYEVSFDYLLKLKKDLNVADNDFVITSVARLHKQKNIDTLIRAIDILNKKFSNFKILICGEGREKKELKVLSNKLGLGKKILFLGLRDDVSAILKISDIFILPSIKEGMSNALLEAMSMGLPCVVSDIEENKELIQDDKTGFTFETGDFNSLSEKIEFIRKNKSQAEVLSNNAKELVSNKYSIENVIEKFANFLSVL